MLIIALLQVSATGATNVPIANSIWFQGYQLTSNASSVAVYPSWLYFDNTVGANWVVNMAVAANGPGSTVEYTISYYSV